MSENSEAASGGIGVCGFLGVIFVMLKLLGVITWSWWWVTLPFWGGIALVLGLLFLAGVITMLFILITTIFERRDHRSKF